VSQQAPKEIKQPAELDQKKLTELVEQINESATSFVEVCPDLLMKRYGDTPHILIKSEGPVSNEFIYVRRDAIRLLGHLLLKLTDRGEPKFGGK
jgi:hypothetical protein